MEQPKNPVLTWDALSDMLRAWRGTHVTLQEVRELQGGITCATLLMIDSDGQRAVAKLSLRPEDGDCAREARHLQWLRQLGFPAPAVYLHRIGTPDAPLSYLLMEFRPGVDLYAAQRLCDEQQWDGLMGQLGELFSTLHSVTGNHYGPALDSPSNTSPSWPQHFRRTRHWLYRLYHELVQIPAFAGRHRNIIQSTLSHLRDPQPGLT